MANTACASKVLREAWQQVQLAENSVDAFFVHPFPEWRKNSLIYSLVDNLEFLKDNAALNSNVHVGYGMRPEIDLGMIPCLPRRRAPAAILAARIEKWRTELSCDQAALRVLLILQSVPASWPSCFK
eukprot:2330005-Lingulodinium_polyedra.AAC.1